MIELLGVMKKACFIDGRFFFLGLVTLVFITSCRGQENDNLRVIQTAPSVSAESEEDVWIDPIFFVEGQLCQHVRKIYQDSRGHLWFGTNVYDLMCYDGDTLEYLTEDDGFAGGRVTAIVEDQEERVWFGSSGGLTSYDGTNFKVYTEEDGLLNNEIWSVIIDADSNFWIGTNAGVSHFDGDTFRTIDIPKGEVEDPQVLYDDDRITSVVQDLDGNLWFGMDGYGICKYDGKTFTNYTTKEGLPDNSINQLMVDSKGRIWIATYFGGLSMYDGLSFHNYTKDGVIDGVEVGGLYETIDGDIWFAVENNGVYHYDGSTFTHLYKEQGLITNGILSIFQDRESRFWFGGWGGLFRYDGGSFESVTKDGPWDE